MVLLWFLIIFLSIGLIFRYFGKYIIRFLLIEVMKRVARNVENQSRAYRSNYDQDPYHENIHINDDVKVKAPKHDEKRKVHPDEIAEDIDFEEVNQEDQKY